MERVGPGRAAAVALLELPGSNRALIFERTGDIRLVSARGLVDELFVHVPVDTSCAAHGILDATWDPTARGRFLYLSYTNATTRALAVGRIDVTTKQLTQVYAQATAAACSNVGGALAFGADGMLYLGSGDMGQPSRAGSPSGTQGKIFRMTRDGALPGPPDAPNPFDAGSYLYALGVRDPVRMNLDTATGEAWFLDIGPAGDKDELNRLVSLGNYGWNTNQVMGYQDIPGFAEPTYTWDPAVKPTGLVAYHGANLARALEGKILVATGETGELIAVTPDLADPLGSTAARVFTRDATGPQSFTALSLFNDGFVYLLDQSGDVHRFLSSQGTPREPSSRESIVPMTAHKLSGGNVEIAVERVPGALEYGVYVGDIAPLRTTGYSHQASPATLFPADGNIGDATTRMTLTAAQAGGPGRNTYLLVSARRDCVESGLGRGDAGDRPRGATDCTIAVLGGGSHSIDDVVVTTIATATAGLTLPRDLEFHPDATNELWVVNRGDHSAVIITDPGEPGQRTSKRVDPGSSQHFFAQPSALAFGPGTRYFATSHEEDDYTQGPPPIGTPQDFMGPTLWTNDSAIFDGGHASHYDMLHNSPNSTGIAWESGQAYWVNDGYHGSLTRYDFVMDHGLGGSDHSDGIITRYAEGEISYVPDVVSHVVYDPAADLVYAVDTGNSRIAVLDPATGTNGGSTTPNYDGCVQTKVNGADVWTLVDGAPIGMTSPSGMEMWDGMLFVSDYLSSTIYAFTLDGGLVDYLETGFPAGTLMGMAFDPRNGDLYVVDVLTDRVLRIRPRQ
jgi:glucose/arabinose dehydrogenase/DNA-binding beta-propeller fold protein YncE